jgi:hypothetical protein
MYITRGEQIFLCGDQMWNSRIGHKLESLQGHTVQN